MIIHHVIRLKLVQAVLKERVELLTLGGVIQRIVLTTNLCHCCLGHTPWMDLQLAQAPSTGVHGFCLRGGGGVRSGNGQGQGALSGVRGSGSLGLLVSFDCGRNECHNGLDSGFLLSFILWHFLQGR